MSVPLFRPNQIVWFRTNYNDGTDDFTKYRPWLLKEIDKTNKLLVFFPITSNRTRYKVFISQFRILSRLLCAAKKFSSSPSFVNVNRLITVPIEISHKLDFCCSCMLGCLEEKEFIDILRLYSKLPHYQVVKVRQIDLTKEEFSS